MSLLVVGTIAYDSVSLGTEPRVDSLGGSATYFSIAASFFTSVAVVAVVGKDFEDSDRQYLLSRGVDISGMETAGGQTFRWSGSYDPNNMNIRETLETKLNVLAEFTPVIDDKHKNSDYLFLANIDPLIQINVLEQMASRPRLVAMDTMNFWIDDHVENLRETVALVDVLFMDENEIKTFTGKRSVIEAAKSAREMGPKVVVVKKGEHGVLVFNEGDTFSAPAFPLEKVKDPTGAGDCFAGGFMGYLSRSGDLSAEGFRRATIVGSVMGSYAVENFGSNRFESLVSDEIDDRFRGMAGMTYFDPLSNEDKLLDDNQGSKLIGETH